jgi:hypothetical protein
MCLQMMQNLVLQEGDVVKVGKANPVSRHCIDTQHEVLCPCRACKG